MNCPACVDNTTTTSGQERCPAGDCRVDLIVRNTRGEAWAYDRDGRTVVQPYPNSVAHLRDGPRRAEIRTNQPDRFPEHNVLDRPADPGSHLSLNAPFGRGTKEYDPA